MKQILKLIHLYFGAQYPEFFKAHPQSILNKNDIKDLIIVTYGNLENGLAKLESAMDINATVSELYRFLKINPILEDFYVKNDPAPLFKFPLPDIEAFILRIKSYCYELEEKDLDQLVFVDPQMDVFLPGFIYFMRTFDLNFAKQDLQLEIAEKVEPYLYYNLKDILESSCGEMIENNISSILPEFVRLKQEVSDKIKNGEKYSELQDFIFQKNEELESKIVITDEDLNIINEKITNIIISKYDEIATAIAQKFPYFNRKCYFDQEIFAQSLKSKLESENFYRAQQIKFYIINKVNKG